MPQDPDAQKQERKCLDAAFRLLSRRDHSQLELTRKLKQRGFAEKQITWAMAQCHRYDYLNDERFAHAHARRLQRRGYGVRYIRQSLRDKGLTAEFIELAVDRHCTEQAQLEQCSNLLRKKIKPMQSNERAWTLKPKLYRFLIGRGFSPSIITKSLDHALKNTNT